MNIIDRAIGFFNPSLALDRIEKRQKLLATAHQGASSKRSLKGWSYSKTSPDTDVIPELETLRDRSRDLYRNNSIARGAIQNQITNVVGAGLKLQPRIDRNLLNLSDVEADEWESIAEREFNLFVKNCDASNRSDFYEIQEIVLKSILTSGEIFVLLPQKKESKIIYDLRIQLIEGDRIDTPLNQTTNKNIIGGIEIDKWGAPIAYHISDGYPQDFIGQIKYKRVLARGSSGKINVIHLYNQDRPGQKRGLPYLSPVIDILKNLTRYSESVLQRAIIQSYLTVFVRSETGELPDTPFLTDDQKLTDTEKTVNMELGPGAVVPLMPGESIETVNPIGPDNKYDEFYMTNLKLIGMALEIPMEVMIKHFQSSYSAARAAFLDFWRTVKTRRSWLSRKFCQVIYEEFLIEAILKGRLIAPGFFDDPIYRDAWSKAQWNGPSPGQIDPIKEVEAYILQRDNGFITNQDASAQINGSDWESNIRALKTENELKKNSGLVE